MKNGEYVCPNCLKEGRPGLRFGVELIGIPYRYGSLWVDMNGLKYRIFCLSCLERGVIGLDGVKGLVAEQFESGWKILKL